MDYYHQIKKKKRPLTPDEQVGMANLLSGLKKLRQQAVTKGKNDRFIPIEATK